MKRSIAFLSVLLAAAALASCAGKSSALTWGTNAEFQPFEYKDSGKIIGIDADIAAAVAKDAGVELKTEDMKFDSLITALASGKIDFVAAGMTVTDERKQNVDFSTPYFDASQVIIINDKSKVAGADDLATARVGVQQGTTGDDYVATNYKGAKLDRYGSGFEAVQALLQGKLDAVVIDSYPAKALAAKDPSLKILDKPLTVEQYAIAVKKGNAKVLDRINATLKRLSDSGELQQIFSKYISQ